MIHHRDTEDTEIKAVLLCVLRASVVNF